MAFFSDNSDCFKVKSLLMQPPQTHNSSFQQRTLQLESARATEQLGGALLQPLAGGAVIWLLGDLGAGKTTLVRGALRQLGYLGTVKSPTYTLVEPYLIGERSIYHFDLYRLGTGEELEDLGIRDYLEAGALLWIEWPQQGGALTPAADLVVELTVEGEGRRATVSAYSPLGLTLLRSWESRWVNHNS